MYFGIYQLINIVFIDIQCCWYHALPSYLGQMNMCKLHKSLHKESWLHTMCFYKKYWALPLRKHKDYWSYDPNVGFIWCMKSLWRMSHLCSHTMVASTMSRRDRKCAHECTSVLDGKKLTVSQKITRNMVHETLLTQFARDGILPEWICNNAKQMIKVYFYLKLKEESCHQSRLNHILSCFMWLKEILMS